MPSTLTLWYKMFKQMFAVHVANKKLSNLLRLVVCNYFVNIKTILHLAFNSMIVASLVGFTLFQSHFQKARIESHPPTPIVRFQLPPLSSVPRVWVLVVQVDVVEVQAADLPNHPIASEDFVSVERKRLDRRSDLPKRWFGSDHSLGEVLLPYKDRVKFPLVNGHWLVVEFQPLFEKSAKVKMGSGWEPSSSI